MCRSKAVANGHGGLGAYLSPAILPARDSAVHRADRQSNRRRAARPDACRMPLLTRNPRHKLYKRSYLGIRPGREEVQSIGLSCRRGRIAAQPGLLLDLRPVGCRRLRQKKLALDPSAQGRNLLPVELVGNRELADWEQQYCRLVELTAFQRNPAGDPERATQPARQSHRALAPLLRPHPVRGACAAAAALGSVSAGSHRQHLR